MLVCDVVYMFPNKAQEAQREMSQLEQQYDELEQVGCQIEHKLRQAGPDDDVTNSQLMRQFLGLVNERNALACRINELSLRSVTAVSDTIVYWKTRAVNDELWLLNHCYISKYLWSYGEVLSHRY